ncbi:MAG: hypothetical protein A2Z18_10165 [Armatimonadetes bacterium RBG_16_58_9]|nr:MAG: hypothetical protein A2Z18_10165 [Armatimonadetes bacterium RBG_16_58_9]
MRWLKSTFLTFVRNDSVWSVVRCFGISALCILTGLISLKSRNIGLWGAGIMNQRERWLAAMHFQPVDHAPDREFGYWPETLEAWHAQGLPGYVGDNERAGIYFGFERQEGAHFHVGIMPGFERRVLEEDDHHQVILDWDGAKKLIHKDGSTSMPKFLKFPIESRADWEEFKKRLYPSTPGRFPERWEWESGLIGDWMTLIGGWTTPTLHDPGWIPREADWQSWKAVVAAADYPLGIGAGSLFGVIRDWMGFENVSYTIMDDPGLIQEIMEHLTNLILSVIERPVREAKFDFAHMWEDMCYNHGPILPPKYFEEWMVPRLKRITSFLADHGCDVVMVDCDGNINELVPLWLEAGVNCMLPLEIRGGTDPVELRKKYGQRILLTGGVDKTRLAAGREEIGKEIARLKPIVEDGGYIPHVDHRCPPDVTFENYLYYLKLKREAFGIPEPEHWEVRKDQYEWANR